MEKNKLTIAISFFCLTATAQTDREIKNLTAFAEAYGYVKYFHPSDEANQLDWNAFAVYGADQILQANNDKEAFTKLNGLYKSLAPTARFYLEEDKIPYAEENLNPQKQNVTKVTYWQHNGVSFGMVEGGPSPYKSRRVNVDKEVDESARFGNIMHKIDAEPYQGLKFRYTAAVKMAEFSEGKGHLWFRVNSVLNV